jgi:hypothetical protein
MKSSIFLIITVVLLNGCASVKPITQNIINDIGGYNEINKFQYYLSTKIILNDAERVRNQQNISKYGSASITDTIYKNKIIIRKNTMGVLINSKMENENDLELEICFEEDDNKKIIFRQQGPGSDRKLYIVYDDPVGRTINYGGELYKVEYSGQERPYLRVKVYKRLSERTKLRWVRGRRVKNN